MVVFETFDGLLPRADDHEFPPGDNDTDTIFGGNHFSIDRLRHFNYTYYSNRTVSNNSKCYLTFPPHQPVRLYENGTFLNATKCFTAINPIGTRGYTGIGFAACFGLALVLTITALAKHGPLHLRQEKRFHPIGRRWQWYWGCFVAATALISLMVNVDVDRYYLQELPIIVTVFFWFLMCQGTVALTWEAVRHWGSWQERQFIDPNPFVYKDNDRRAQVEFWLPMWFYLWTWLNFFLIVPRSWSFASYQRSHDQTAQKAIPAATDTRFKAAAFCLVISWLTICYSLRHSIKHYQPRNRGILNRSMGFVKAIPLRFVLLLPLTLALIAYQTFISFVWDFSIIRYDGVVPVIYGWGYGPSLLILLIQIAYGWASPNEDKDLIRQRRERGDMLDRELGLVKKPAWWRRVRGDHMGGVRDKILRNVTEIGGGRATGRRIEDDMERHARQEAEMSAINDDGIELQSMSRKDSTNPRIDRAGARSVGAQSSALPRYQGSNERRHAERVMETAAGLLFPNDNTAEAERVRRAAELGEDGPPPAYTDERTSRRESGRPGSGPRSNSADTTNSISAPPQQVRSMLDI